MRKVILAYSGGLDTSFCIPYLTETLQAEVHAVHINCTGLPDNNVKSMKKRAMELGAHTFVHIDAFDDLYNKVLVWLLRGNVLRDRTYPLSVGSERFIQAEKIAQYALDERIYEIAHGSTGAGNDQVRFDVALRSLMPDVTIHTPIRDNGFTRQETTAYLVNKGYSVHDKMTQYSINEGIWGTTIGGKETTTSDKKLPFDAFPNINNIDRFADKPETLEIEFHNGIPIRAANETGPPRALLGYIKAFGERHGIGRGMHLGDTILGIKGRIGFEAPVATILYFAHRELEKLVLTKWQRLLKDQLSDTYGMHLHEGNFYDPVMRDIESYLLNSQVNVNGRVSIEAWHGSLYSAGVSSPNSLMNHSIARYGEEHSGWTGVEARAFSKIYGISSQIANHVKKK